MSELLPQIGELPSREIVSHVITKPHLFKSAKTAVEIAFDAPKGDDAFAVAVRTAMGTVALAPRRRRLLEERFA